MKTIVLEPYNQLWPQLFKKEAKQIQKALGENCLAVHHVGSTAVPGLISKPVIDVIVVVVRGEETLLPLEAIGFKYQGEWNIPFKFGFKKRDAYAINLHVLEEGHPEIYLNVIIRDRLRRDVKARRRYAALKEELVVQPSSHVKSEGAFFVGYTRGKDPFIRLLLNEEGYKEYRLLYPSHHLEWEEYHRIKEEQLFSSLDIVYDRNHISMHHALHKHFILCTGVYVVAIAHLECLTSQEYALRAVAVDTPFQKKGLGKK
ncbi:MAG: GrpB family protein, partial [Candidatus Babeliales bacterium]